MPRGTKTCKNQSCGAANGPRSFFCKECGEPFVVKGKKSTPIMKAATDTNDYKEHFDEIDYSRDESNVRNFDGTARCWVSKCGKFRIRQYKTFQGIDVGHSRRTILESRIEHPAEFGPKWKIVSRHVVFKSAGRRYVRMARQQKIRKTAEEQRQESFNARLSHRLTRK